ncbi:hypothetical protein [Domibacillus mangrovi]|uniref:hypothetical protein n=1 Tax=Domibacillus mangrovi TaxID=1714354 RepID=UPI000AD303C3|nr:hypothetical protein [Domibacillus mangrovi]
MKEVRFHVYRHDTYVHRLYQKFASVVEEQEDKDQYGYKDVFAVPFGELKEFLESF